MIGVGFEKDGQFQFRNFTCSDYTFLEERRIVSEFRDFITTIRLELDPENEYPVRFFHWAHVEKTLLEAFFRRSDVVWRNYDDIRWVDMCSVFTTNPIVVKGSMTFKLKDIAKAMCNSGLIKTSWDDNYMSNGMIAMTKAIEYYFSENRDTNVMNIISRYNMIDCKVVWEIVNYLRK